MRLHLLMPLTASAEFFSSANIGGASFGGQGKGGGKQGRGKGKDKRLVAKFKPFQRTKIDGGKKLCFKFNNGACKTRDAISTMRARSAWSKATARKIAQTMRLERRPGPNWLLPRGRFVQPAMPRPRFPRLGWGFHVRSSALCLTMRKRRLGLMMQSEAKVHP